MHDSNEVTLRYFACRGRAQPLRDALSDAGVAFADMRVTDWASRQREPEVAGLFASLPTRRWGDLEACETLPIARLLTEKLGHGRGLTEQRSVQLEAVCSAMLMDVIVPVAGAIWADVMHPGVDPVSTTRRQLSRWLGKLARGSALLSTDALFLGGDAPVVADFFLFEAFDALGSLLGPAHVDRLEPALPRLVRLRSDLLDRPRFADCYALRPSRFTGRPDEAAVVARLHACEPTELWPTRTASAPQ